MTDLFDEKNTPSTPATPEVKVDDTILDLFADKLLAIKKEDGTPKYDTLEKALDALAASQQHIPRLEAENKLLADKAARAAELEEIVKRMSNGNTEPEKPVVVTPPSGGLSKEDAATLVRQVLNEEKQVSVAVQNVMGVQNKLIETYGGEAGALEALKAKAKELGTTLPKLKELSAQSPDVVLALFGRTSGSPSATTSSINGGAFRPQETELKRPEKSLISGVGATDKNRIEFMKQVRDRVNKRLGVTNP